MGRIYSKIFGNLYDRVMLSAEKSLAEKRNSLLAGLSGDVLEIGSGTGVNFQYYNSTVNITAIEPNVTMLEKSKPKIDSKNIKLINIGVNDANLNFENEKFDSVVCTLVLCTIFDLELAFKNISKWLKPNGELIVLEHIKSKNKLKGNFQSFINPAWKIIGDGCNLNRNTDDLIKKAGFESVNEEYNFATVLWYSGVFKKTNE